jgi:hypothetical protein
LRLLPPCALVRANEHPVGRNDRGSIEEVSGWNRAISPAPLGVWLAPPERLRCSDPWLPPSVHVECSEAHPPGSRMVVFDTRMLATR